MKLFRMEAGEKEEGLRGGGCCASAAAVGVAVSKVKGCGMIKIIWARIDMAPNYHVDNSSQPAISFRWIDLAATMKKREASSADKHA